MTNQPYIPDLPGGAWKAIRLGTDYEEKPDFDFESWWYFYDDDEDWWTGACVNHDYIVENGVPRYATWLLWKCGDIRIEDTAELDSPSAESDLIVKTELDRKRSVIAYLKWVAETGKDPMQHFRPIRTKNADVIWAFRAKKHEDGYPILAGIYREGDGWVAKPPKDSDAEFFLCLDGYRIGTPEGQTAFTWDDLLESKEIDIVESSDTDILATFVLEERISISKEENRKYTAEQAAKQLELMKDQAHWKEAF